MRSSTRTEREIETALRTVSADRTTLVIAHRLSTVVDADEILVLAEGEVAERGTHASLLAADGLYARMWALQIEQGELPEPDEGQATVEQSKMPGAGDDRRAVATAALVPRRRRLTGKGVQQCRMTPTMDHPRPPPT